MLETYPLAKHTLSCLFVSKHAGNITLGIATREQSYCGQQGVWQDMQNTCAWTSNLSITVKLLQAACCGAHWAAQYITRLLV